VGVSPGFVAPKRGWLVNIPAGVAHDSEVVWRAGGLLGVRFTETINVQTPIDGTFGFLHRLWIDCVGR
jgi:hypothetical protein